MSIAPGLEQEAWDTDVCAVWFEAAAAELKAEFSGSGAVVDILSYSDQGFVGRLSLPGVFLESVSAAGLDFTHLEVPGWGFSGSLGQAELPVLRTSLLLPDDTEAVVYYSVLETISLGRDFQILPVQPAEPEDGSEVAFAYDADYYLNGAAESTALVTVTDPAIARGTSVALLEIAPFVYDPLTDEITVVTELEFAVQYQSVIVVQAESGSSDVSLGSAATAADYLIIVADEFYEEVQPLAEWKQLKGFPSYVAKMSEVGSTAADIQNYISAAYNDGSQVTYVLLVGDYDDVPSNNIGTYLSDHPYACVDGTDYLPDVTLGRISVNTEAEATTVIDKILRYERNPNLGDWYDDVLCAGYFQDYNDYNGYADRWFMETTIHVRNYLRDVQGMTTHTALCADESGGPPYYYRSSSYPHRISVSGSAPYPVPQSVVDEWTSASQATADVSTAINAGVGFVQHRDHGGSTGWGDPPYHVAEVNALTNGTMTPVVFSTNCSTGTFNYASGDCFAEAFLKHTNGGCVGIVAATRTSYSGYNDLLVHGTYTCFWPDYDSTHTGNPYPYSMRPAEAMNFGKYYMYSYEGNTSTTVIEFNEFHWFGDPEMMLRTETPQALTVTHATTVPMGVSTDYVVSVFKGTTAVEGALVCISRSGSDDYWTAYTGADGTATISGLTSHEWGLYDLVVTECNAIPYETTVESLQPSAVLGTLVTPSPGSVATVDLGYVDVVWTDYSGTGLNTATIGIGDITIAGVAINGVSDQGGGVWRYTYTGSPAEGMVSVMFVSGEVLANNGDTSGSRLQSFTFHTLGATVLSHSLNGSTSEPQSAIEFTFSEAMDPASFSLVDDVASFTGPGGDLMAQITGFQWLSGNTVLEIQFNAQSALGSYQMVIGPGILDLVGHAMNQNGLLPNGEVSGDQYTGAFTIIPCATCGDLVWQDLDGDGLQDPGEPGLAGVLVEVFSTTDAVIGNNDDRLRSQAVTDAYGRYTVGQVPVGMSCYLVFHVPAGYTFSLQDVGSDDASDSDAGSNGVTALFTLESGTTHLNFDAGVVSGLPAFGLALDIGGYGTDYGQAVAVDGWGNVYIAGYFSGTTDFDPGPAAYSLKSTGSDDVFVAKYNTQGAILWARCLGNVSSDHGLAIVVDDQGHVLATGNFQGTVDFDPGPDIRELTSSGQTDVFVVQFDAEGNLVWAARSGGTGSDSASGLARDSAGNVYLTGQFNGTADFGAFNLTSVGGSDVFAAKLDNSGNFLWAGAFGGTSSDYGYGIAVAGDGSVWTTGYFSGTADFDPGSASTATLTASGTDVFVSRLDSDGSYIWAGRLGGSGSDYGRGIAVDGDGNAYVAGYFSGTADFDPGASTSNLTTNGGNDIFVAKLSANGSLTWAHNLGGTYTDCAYAIALAADGSVLTTGYYQGVVDFDPGVNRFELTSAGNWDVFISSLNSDGELNWTRSVGGADANWGSGIAAAGGSVWTIGYFVNTADFDPSAGVFNLTSAGGSDIFLSKLLPEQAPSDLDLSTTNVLEHQPVGSVVGLLSAVDADATERFTYSLVAGAGDDDNAQFAIDGDQLKTAAVFDRDAQSSYRVRLRVSDHAGRWYEESLTILVDEAKRLGNFVWNDLDSDGLQDAGEPGLAGVVVEVYSSTDSVVGNSDDVFHGTTLTDANGSYLSYGLPLDTYGYLVFRTPAGFTFTIANAGDDTLDSDASAAGATAAFLVSGAEDDVRWDAGLVGTTPIFGFVATAGSSSGDFGQAVTTDAAGNVFVAGRLQGTADFDPGPGTCSLTSSGNEDIFIAKYTPQGALLWARAFGSTDVDRGYAVAAAADGSVYLSGTFRGTVDFDPGPDAYTFTTIDASDDAFVLKLDSDGDFLWAAQFGGEGTDQGRSLAVAADGSVYTAGVFSDVVDFCPGPNAVNLTTAGGYDVFVSKLTSAGNYVWARQLGGASSDYVSGIAEADDGSVYTTGYFYGTADFNPSSSSTFNLTSAGSADVFVSKLNSSGNFVWAKRVGGTSSDYAYGGVAVAADGSVYVAGAFQGTADFDPSDTANCDLTSAGYYDAFVCKLNVAGDFVWAERTGAASYDYIYGIAATADGSLVTAGYFGSTVDFDPGSATFNLIASGYDAFVSRLSSEGAFLSALKFGGSSSDYLYGLALAADGSVCTTGCFNSTADFNPGPGAFNRTSVGSADIYVSKLQMPLDLSLSSSGIEENLPAGTLVGELATSDPTTADSFTYALVSGDGATDNALFALQGNRLITTAVFDYETQSTYSIRIRTTDAAGLFLERGLAISVTNVFDTPPVVSSTSFAAGSLPLGSTSLTVQFDREVFGADDSANFQLQGLGSDGLLGTADDPTIALSARYSGTTATLDFAALPAGVWRLTASDAIADSRGWLLDGDADGIEGADWAGDFVVAAAGGAASASSTNIDFGDSEYWATVIQPDGKILVAGSVFTGSYRAFSIARYSTDGVLDTTFGSGGQVATAVGTSSAYAYGLALQADGKILATGYASNSSNNDIALVRYNGDGSLDTTFSDDGIAIAPVGTSSDYGRAVAVQSDGKILVAGYAYVGTTYDFALARFNADGTLDTTFGNNGTTTTAIGTTADYAYAMAVQATGEIVLAGYSHNGTDNDFALVRYHSDGSLDTTFDTDGIVTTAIGTSNDIAYSLGIQSDGKIVAAGYATMTNADFALVRYYSNGRLDETFDTDGIVTTAVGTSTGDYAYGMSIQSDGTIVAAGYMSSDFAVVRYNSTGALDTSFDGDGKATSGIGTSTDYGRCVAVQSDGRIVVAGSAIVGNRTDAALARWNATGGLDTTFSGDGKLTAASGASSDEARAVVLQADGRAVVAGGTTSGSDWALARYTVDGAADTTFDSDGKHTTAMGSNGYAQAVVVQSDGKIVAAGYGYFSSYNQFALARYKADGSLDTTFSGDGKVNTDIGSGADQACAAAIQSDGKIVVAGQAYTGTNNDFALVRYNSDGSLDTTFSTDGIVTTAVTSSSDYAYAVAIQSDGKILVAGYANGDVALVRYNADGSLDATFSGDGIVTTAVGTGADYAYALAIQDDGKIVLAGYTSNAGTNDFALVRYKSDGSLDTTFDGDGKAVTPIGTAAVAYALAIQDDGKILAAGYSQVGSGEAVAVVRYNADGSLDTSFDDDGKYTSSFGADKARAYAVALRSDGTIILAGYTVTGGNRDILLASVTTPLVSAAGLEFDVDRLQSGAGQLIQGTNGSFDGLGRLQVGAASYAPTTAGTLANDASTLTLATVSLSGLEVHREVTVPDTGTKDFARTVDVFTNPTASAITTTVRIVGNLGSDAATTVWTTSDGDTLVETTDQWIGTDDADGSGTPAIIHYIHGPWGTRPTNVTVTGDNIEWTYELTVEPGATARLACFTILADARTDAEAAAATLVTATGFGGQAAAFLAPVELESLANFDFLSAPGTPDLVAPYDTGSLSDDNLTRFDNSSAAQVLAFDVSGTLAEATVTIYADGVAIGSAVATADGITRVTTSGTADLTDGSHAITARQTEAGGVESLDSSSMVIQVDTGATRLTGIYAAGSAWKQPFLDVLESAGVGAAELGYRLVDGADQLAKSSTVTWSNVDTLRITFSESATVSQSSLTLYNSLNESIASTGFAAIDASTYQWTFATLGANKYWIALESDLTADLAGNALDGEWTTSTTTYANSGNGVAGGDCNFRFNLLPGDVNLSAGVNSTDVAVVRNRGMGDTDTTNYRRDLNGSGMVNSTDVALVRNREMFFLIDFDEPVLPEPETATQSVIVEGLITESLSTQSVSTESLVTTVPPGTTMLLSVDTTTATVATTPVAESSTLIVAPAVTSSDATVTLSPSFLSAPVVSAPFTLVNTAQLISPPASILPISLVVTSGVPETSATTGGVLNIGTVNAAAVTGCIVSYTSAPVLQSPASVTVSNVVQPLVLTASAGAIDLGQALTSPIEAARGAVLAVDLALDAGACFALGSMASPAETPVSQLVGIVPGESPVLASDSSDQLALATDRVLDGVDFWQAVLPSDLSDQAVV